MIQPLMDAGILTHRTHADMLEELEHASCLCATRRPWRVGCWCPTDWTTPKFLAWRCNQSIEVEVVATSCLLTWSGSLFKRGSPTSSCCLRRVCSGSWSVVLKRW